MLRCSHCKGLNVEQLIAGWVNANDWSDAPDHMGVAELYTQTDWCNDCEWHHPLEEAD